MKNANGNYHKKPLTKGYALFYVNSMNFTLNDDFIEFRFTKEMPSPLEMIQDLSLFDDGVFCYIYDCSYYVSAKNIDFKIGNFITMFGGFESYGI